MKIFLIFLIFASFLVYVNSLICYGCRWSSEDPTSDSNCGEQFNPVGMKIENCTSDSAVCVKTISTRTNTTGTMIMRFCWEESIIQKECKSPRVPGVKHDCYFCKTDLCNGKSLGNTYDKGTSLGSGIQTLAITLSFTIFFIWKIST